MATIALILDSSSSMNDYGYLSYAITDSCTFVNIMQDGDGVSVVRFDDAAYLVQALITLVDQSTADDVCTAIQGITAQGHTNISAGISMANDQIEDAASPLGMVLLSDGMWNRGDDPLDDLPDIPIYTIALGNWGELELMQEIAAETGGTYNYAPGYQELAQIYNDIVSETNVARTVTNELDSVSPYGYQEISTPIASGISQAKFTLSWADDSVSYTPDTPTGNEVQVTVYAPGGVQQDLAPVWSDNGVVVFEVDDPQAGEWSVGCWYAGESGGADLACTWGGFEPPDSAELSLIAPAKGVPAGETASIEVSFADAGEPLERQRIRAHVSAPVESAEEVLGRGSAAKPAAGDGTARSARWLDAERRAGRPLPARKYVESKVVTRDPDTSRIEVGDTTVRGSYLVKVKASGYSKARQSPVHRTRVVSFRAV